LGTNENFLVCDDAYGIVGVHPVATASVTFPEMTVGLRTTNPKVIQGLVDRYRNPVLDQIDGVAYFNRAVTRDALGDKMGAIADYSEVLRIQSDHDVAYNNRALVRYELGDHVGAIADLQQAILCNSQNAVAHCNRGVLQLRQGDKLSAIEDFSAAIQIDPDSIDAYLQRGTTRLKLGNKIGAIEDFTRLLQLDSQNGTAYFHRGMASSEMGDRLNAMRDLKEAARLFLSQNDPTKHQHAIEAMQKLRQKFGQSGVTELRLVREA
jgi:tetratricopeptide (TPR) repeat protein